MKKTRRIIAKITVGQNNVTIDENLIDVEFEDLDRANVNDLLNFGIYANRGSLSFVDKEGWAQQIISQSSSVLDRVKVELYLAGNSQERLLKTLFVNDIEINEDTNVVTLELISRTITWQNITLPPIYIWANPSSSGEYQSTPTTVLINSINKILTNQNQGFQIGISPESEDLFSRCEIYCIYIEKDTLWNVITKICELCGGRIYEDEYGNPYISTDFIYHDALTSPITIKPRNILQISNHSPYYKNQINQSVSARFKKRERKTGAIDNGHPFTIYESDGSFVENNPRNTDTTVSSIAVSSQGIVYAEINSRFNCNHKLFVPDEQWEPWCTVRALYKNTGETYSVDVENYSSYYSLDLNFFECDFTLAAERVGTGNRLEQASVQISASYFVDGEDYEAIISGGLDSRGHYALPTNELFQTQSVYQHETRDQKYSDFFLYNCFITPSRDTVEMECTLSDYYEGDHLSISSNNLQTFKRGDIVIPYVIRKGQEVEFNANPQYYPAYKVVGIKYSYMGILRQKLYLQEIIKG